MGNIYSIPSFSKPCLETKSLAASSCRFNQRFPGKKGETAENISKGRCPHRLVSPKERIKPSPRGKVARASPASARRMRAKAPLPTEGEPLRLSKNRVIASQCSHWRGNPFSCHVDYPDISGNADCHTSDIGHWFAMTANILVAHLDGKCSECSSSYGNCLISFSNTGRLL